MSYVFKTVDELTFTDDFMFGTIMKNPEICKGVIERLLHIKVGKIEYPSLQKRLPPSMKVRESVWMSMRPMMNAPLI